MTPEAGTARAEAGAAATTTTYREAMRAAL